MNSQMALPKPSGKDKVGFFKGEFKTEEDRICAYRCYYPTYEENKGVTYYDEDEILDYQLQHPMFAQLEEPLSILNFLETNSQENAKVIKTKKKLPVILYSPGFTSLAWSNLIQVEELASQGYIVFCLSHPGDNFYTATSQGITGLDNALVASSQEEDQTFFKTMKTMNPKEISTEQVQAYLKNSETLGKQVERRVDDLEHLLDEIETLNSTENSLFYQRLQTEKIGIFGHSLGGASGFRLSQKDPRIKACVNFDGWQYGEGFTEGTVGAPSLGLFCYDNHLAGNYPKRDQELSFFIIPDAVHYSFIDIYQTHTPLVQMLSPEAKVAKEEMKQVMNTSLLYMFNRYLKNEEQESLNDKLNRINSDIYES